MTREALIKHWNVIQAFKEGKQIQYNDSVPQTWQDTTDPQFKLAVEYRVKPKQTKQYKNTKEIVEVSHDGKTWQEYDKYFESFSHTRELQTRVRIVECQTKRLPTIEEVEQLFLDNKVFRYKNTDNLARINKISKGSFEPICITHWISIKEFCEYYANYDGSELYITE